MPDDVRHDDAGFFERTTDGPPVNAYGNGPDPGPEDLDRPSAPLQSFGRLASLSELDRLTEPKFVIDGIAEEGTELMLWGREGSLKTTVLADWYRCILTGENWCGRHVEQGIVLHVPLEDRRGFAARLQILRELHGDLPPHLVWWDGAFEFSEACMLDIRSKLLDLAIAFDLPVRMIGVDPFTKAFKGSATEDQDMRRNLALIRTLNAPFPNATTVLVTHSGWADEHELGSIMQRALTSTSIQCRAQESVVSASVVRQKNGVSGAQFWFTVRPDDRAGMVSLIPRKAPEASAEGLPDNARMGWEALLEVVNLYGSGDYQHLEFIKPPSQKFENGAVIKLSGGVSVDHWRDEYDRRRPDTTDVEPDTIRRGFIRAVKDLQKRGKVIVLDKVAQVRWIMADTPGQETDT